MTKERRLAIDLWLWIRDRYADWNDYFWGSGDTDGFLDEMKYRFFDENNIELPKWRAMCWLCQYTQDQDVTYPFDCTRCPLKSCSRKNSAYYVLNLHTYKDDLHVSEEVYRNCCSTVLNALGYEGD